MQLLQDFLYWAKITGFILVFIYQITSMWYSIEIKPKRVLPHDHIITAYKVLTCIIFVEAVLYTIQGDWRAIPYFFLVGFFIFILAFSRKMTRIQLERKRQLEEETEIMRQAAERMKEKLMESLHSKDKSKLN